MRLEVKGHFLTLTNTFTDSIVDFRTNLMYTFSLIYVNLFEDPRYTRQKIYEAGHLR